MALGRRGWNWGGGDGAGEEGTVLGLSLLLDWLKAPVLWGEEMLMGQMWELGKSSECPNLDLSAGPAPLHPAAQGREI